MNTSRPNKNLFNFFRKSANYSMNFHEYVRMYICMCAREYMYIQYITTQKFEANTTLKIFNSSYINMVFIFIKKY